MRRNPERGSAMLVTLILIASLLAGAAVLVSMQLASNRATELSRTGNMSLYCAEAGLAAARPIVAANYKEWGPALTLSGAGITTEPAFLVSGIDATTPNHDLNGDGVPDFRVYLLDNDDEIPPAPNDKLADNDLRVFIVSRCTAYPDTPKEIVELIEWSGGGTCYQSQEGGCAGNGNSN